MYKKCDIIKTRTFKFDKQMEFTDKLDLEILKEMNSVSEMIKKEIERMKKELDEKALTELKKFKIKTTKPQYIKAWLTRKRLVVHMIVDGLNTQVRIVPKEKESCSTKIIKENFSARDLLGKLDCVLMVSEKAFNELSVSDRVYIEASCALRLIEIKIIKEE
jgi:hypothetical protein